MMSCHTLRDTRPPQRVVIFDSPDGTGKSNIAQGLSMKLNIPYFRMDTQHANWRKGKFKEALEFDQPYIAEFLRWTRYDAIIDRAYPSEWVYSQVLNRETDTNVLNDVDIMFARLGTFIVIPVRRDYSKSRKDEVVPSELLPKLHDKYLEFAQWTRCSNVVIYVDDFKNDLKREIDVLLPELDFGTKFPLSVTLSREEKKIDVARGRTLGK